MITANSDLDVLLGEGEPVRISHCYRLSFNGHVRSAHCAFGGKAAEIRETGVID